MPTLISHVVVAVAATKAFAPAEVPGHFRLLSLACSILPDADVPAFSFGIPYGHFFGHRGFFHSLFFALLLSFFSASIFFSHPEIFSGKWFSYLLFLFLVSASHGILDAFTNGGLGIALFSPFDPTRYFFPWTPIRVSHIGLKAFLSHWGFLVIKSEILWIWMPSLLLVLISTWIRFMAARH